MKINSEVFNSLSEKEKLELAPLILAEKARRSLYYYAKKILGYKDINLRTHGEIIECLESDSKKKLIVCPRGAFKSTIAVISYSLWRIIKDPNVRIMLDSETLTNTKKAVKTMRAHLEDPFHVQLFGRMKSDTSWTDTAFTVYQRTKKLNDPTVMAASVDIPRTGSHFDFIIGDDLNSQKNSENQEQRQKVIDHYRYYTSLLDPGATKVIIGTRYATDDVIGHILEKELGIEDVSGFIKDKWEKRNAS